MMTVISAGLVLLASAIEDGRPDQLCFGVLDAVVRRNGYGRQVASFEGEVELGEGPPLPAVFIRAPLVVSVGAEVEVAAAAAEVVEAEPGRLECNWVAELLLHKGATLPAYNLGAEMPLHN